MIIDTRVRRSLGRSIAILLMFISGGCSDGVGPDPVRDGPRASAIQPLSGNAQEGRPGLPLRDSVLVQVLDQNGAALSGAEVSFAVQTGGGTILPARATTDAQGVARALWVLGAQEGAQTAAASVGDVTPLTLSATARFGPEAAIELVAGGGQAMIVGCELPEPVVVRVTDASGAPVAGAPVLIGPAGTKPENGWVERSDAEGLVRAPWEVGTGGSTNVFARIAAQQTDSVGFEVVGVPVAPKGYGTIGNTIYSATSCAPHRFVGVARSGLQFWPDDPRLANEQLLNQELTAMRGWGANVLRLPVYQRYWLRDVRLQGETYTAAAYQARIDSIVQRANAAGLDVIIDLHASDRGDPNFPDDVAQIQQMADVKHSIPFWRQVAEKYENNGRVIFQLYNEPNQISWELWRNGGIVPGGETFPPQSSGVEFEAAGMQQLYDAVRSTGAQNLVIVNGMHWGYDLSQLPAYAISGHNIVYATHPYDYPDKQPGAWDADFGRHADRFPIMIAEFGDYTCNSNGYYNAVLDYADRLNLSWVAWAWFAPPPDQPELICGHPSLLTDWSGTPSPTGQVVRARMQSYRK